MYKFAHDLLDIPAHRPSPSRRFSAAPYLRGCPCLVESLPSCTKHEKSRTRPQAFLVPVQARERLGMDLKAMSHIIDSDLLVSPKQRVCRSQFTAIRKHYRTMAVRTAVRGLPDIRDRTSNSTLKCDHDMGKGLEPLKELKAARKLRNNEADQG